MTPDQGTPQIVGRYEILKEIGRGGMAVVYSARQPDLDRQVALKELSRFHAGSPEFAHRFLRESRLAGSLNHPNVVTVHEYFEHAGTPYIAMEYVPRGSLRPYMRRMSLTQIAGVLEGVLAGLSHAESAGIVHRDLKPENIMVTADGRVKITDFGIARATQQAGTQYMTATGMTVGTPTYMAPEQAMAGDIGPWTDLYSVGILTYELVVGQVPFHGTDAPMVILMRHCSERIPSPIEVVPDVDQGLSEWIDSLLVKDPKDRVRHAAEAWESLEDIVVRLHGPLWRRDARLLEDRLAAIDSAPLTPAPFESQGALPTPPPTPTAAPDAFVTFDPARATPPPAPAAPAPETTPAPAAPEPTATPPAVSEPTAMPPAVPAETAFVTFGATQVPPPAQAPPSPPPTEQPTAPAEQPPATEPAFVTYGQTAAPAPQAPAPQPPAPEPPAPEPPAPEPPAPEPEPIPEPEPETEPLSAAPPAPIPTPATQEQVQPPPPEPAPKPARPSRKAPIGALAAVVALAAAAIGYVVAPSSKKSGGSRSVALTQQVTAGPLKLSFPAGWQQTATVPAGASTLKLAKPVTLTPGPTAPGGALVLGTTTTTDATLLPASFSAALPSAPQGSPVKLGSQTFKRYLDLVPQGAPTPESVYALPTNLGTATAVCVVPTSDQTSFAALCEQAVATLTTTGSVLPLSANPAYASGLNAIVSKLNTARAKLGHQLAAAKTQKAQSAAALALFQAHAQAASAANTLTPGPTAGAANHQIVVALSQLAGGYRSLASAAAHNNKRSYASAQAAITQGNSALSKAFAQLQQDGYKIG